MKILCSLKLKHCVKVVATYKKKSISKFQCVISVGFTTSCNKKKAISNAPKKAISNALFIFALANDNGPMRYLAVGLLAELIASRNLIRYIIMIIISDQIIKINNLRPFVHDSANKLDI